MLCRGFLLRGCTVGLWPRDGDGADREAARLMQPSSRAQMRQGEVDQISIVPVAAAAVLALACATSGGYSRVDPLAPPLHQFPARWRSL